MSLFDILGNNSSMRETLDSIAGQMKNAGRSISQATPGGVGGLLGAGAMGALLGRMMPKGTVNALGLAGLGAVAWAFYKKWAQANPQAAGQRTGPTTLTDTVNDPTLLLLLRAMVFAAKADGHIDETERARMQDMLNQLYPGQDVTPLMEQLVQESIDPSILARQVESPEQAEDVYRLSCLIVDIDHFMERSYLDNLAQVLGLAKETQIALEQEAAAAKRRMASL